MNKRMFAYAAFVYHQHNELPLQLVIYLGEEPWHLKPVITTADPLIITQHTYRLIQMRELEAEVFLASNHLGSLLLAALGHYPAPTPSRCGSSNEPKNWHQSNIGSRVSY
jgi:hypothetical protein